MTHGLPGFAPVDAGSKSASAFLSVLISLVDYCLWASVRSIKNYAFIVFIETPPPISLMSLIVDVFTSWSRMFHSTLHRKSGQSRYQCSGLIHTGFRLPLEHFHPLFRTITKTCSQQNVKLAGNKSLNVENQAAETLLWQYLPRSKLLYAIRISLRGVLDITTHLLRRANGLHPFHSDCTRDLIRIGEAFHPRKLLDANF